MVSGDGLVGGNPTMNTNTNTPRHRRGGWDSILVKLSFTCIGTPIYIVYFVCDSAPELEQWALLRFLGLLP